MTTVDVPTVVAYGQVVGHFVRFDADAADPGTVPDEIPLTGTVTLAPLTDIVRWPTTTPPRLAVAATVTCPVVDGDLMAPDGSTAGVWVVATDQPDGSPDVIQWRASFRFDDVPRQPPAVVFNVPADGVVDLTLIEPAAPQVGVVAVVSHEDAMAAAQSANAAAGSAGQAATSASSAAGSASAAQGSATGAAGSATAARTSETNAASSATAAGTSATAASDSASAASGSEGAASGSASAAAGSASAAQTSAGNAANSASAADTSKTAAAGSASAAQTSATNSADSATASADSAAASADSATQSATSATNSEASASSALSSAMLAGAYFKTAPTKASLPSQAAATLITDSFNRADSSTTLGAPWVVPANSGTWGVRNNNAYTPVASGTAKTFVETNTSEVAVTVKTVAGNATGPIARVIDNQPGTFGATWWTAGANALYYMNGTTHVQKGSAWTPVAAAGDTIRLECRGPYISVWIDYGSTGTFVNKLNFLSAGENQNATKHGMRMPNGTTDLDDFKVTTLGGAGQSYYIVDTATVVVGDGTNWRTVYGDTGWRAITTWDTAGVVTGQPLPPSLAPKAGVAGYMYLLRTGNQVSFRAVGAVATALNSTVMDPIPNGFRPYSNFGVPYLWTKGGTSFTGVGGIGNWATGARLSIGPSMAINDELGRCETTWRTADNWPTTLPGTPVTDPS